jgi:hypothetical protein
VARADNYFAEYRMLFLRRHSNERGIFRGSCIDVIKSRLRKNLKAPASVLAQCSLDLTVYHNRHTRLIALLVFSVQLFVSHTASIYLYNQFQGLRLSARADNYFAEYRMLFL